jgi:chemotaxis protein CheD
MSSRVIETERLQRDGSVALDRTRRHWDNENECWVVRLMPGDCRVGAGQEAITTVLGSCVSACIRDPSRRIGGMNHFMLPEDTTGGKSTWSRPEVGLSARFGSHAMEVLINALLKRGARRDRLEVKLFGGSRILASMTDIGARNVVFIRNFVDVEGLQVVASDLGSIHPRRVLYFPDTGRARVKRLQTIDTAQVATRERMYLERLRASASLSDIELFD